MANVSFKVLPAEIRNEVSCITRTLVRPGKGILAIDETPDTIGKRLAEVGVENDEEHRRQFRQLLIGTGPELAKYVSGIILQEETLHQSNDDGQLLVEHIKQLGIIPGIKADLGVVPLPGTNDETTTQGLDNLSQRLTEYKKLGCDFAKWRCTLRIGPGIPSYQAIQENANVLARYAAICQTCCIVPILEPELLTAGDHDLERTQEVTEAILVALFKALADQHVALEGTLLKPAMVTAGESCPKKFTPEQVARATVETLRRCVPPAVPGVIFLSGGQPDELATENLNAINRVSLLKPWTLTFCYGRALQSSALATWAGQPENVSAAQAQLLKRAKANSKASVGQYEPESLANKPCIDHPPS